MQERRINFSLDLYELCMFLNQLYWPNLVNSLSGLNLHNTSFIQHCFQREKEETRDNFLKMQLSESGRAAVLCVTFMLTSAVAVGMRI